MTRQNNNDTARFSVTKREFENDAIIIFIDLLGTRKLYGSTSAEDQANKTVNVLLGEFDIKFSEYFSEEEIKQNNFDVSIFADSIVISERIKTPKIVERLVNFLLDYQMDLFLNYQSPSRAIILKGSFFSFKITGASKKSILGSKYTNISLCGGKGIKSAHDSLKGLPMGVYVAIKIKKDLNGEQRKRLIPVKGEELYFIKNTNGNSAAIAKLPYKTVGLLIDKPNASRKTIVNSLKESYPDPDAAKKMIPWLLVHLEKEFDIIRAKKR